jgi:hypothetical protein
MESNTAAAGQRAAGRKAGGIRRSQKAVVLPEDAPDLELRTLPEVAALLAETINHTRKGRLDVRVANSLGHLAGTLARVLEGSDLEQRIAKVEQALQAKGGHPGRLT